MNNFNPYEPPKTSTAEFLQFHSQGIKRYGKNGLFVPIGMDLPARCIYCNQPITDKPIKRSYYHDKIYSFLFLIIGIVLLIVFRLMEYFLILFVAFLIVSVVTHRKVTIHIGLCHQHKSKRFIKGWFFVFLAFASFALVVFMNMFNLSEMLAYLAILGGGVAIVGCSFNSHLITKLKINETGCYLKGFGKEFLRSFE